MRKTTAVLLAMLFSVVFLAGCNNGGQSGGANGTPHIDGVYRAEFKNFDSRGYKDTLQLTVKNGVVTAVIYNAVNSEGTLKTKDEKYRAEMEKLQNNYPDKFSTDLANQYIEHQDISKVSAVAGATYSSECFTALFKSLVKNMQTGDVTPVFIDNIPER